jgi:hypothetical protein
MRYKDVWRLAGFRGNGYLLGRFSVLIIILSGGDLRRNFSLFIHISTPFSLLPFFRINLLVINQVMLLTYKSTLLLSIAFFIRAILLLYGQWQDATSPLKYTDIDYLVFTDAARFVSRGMSPYTRDTYRYTPFLAWILYPTTFGGPWILFGKALFALSDLLAGWIILEVLQRFYGMSEQRSLNLASIWLLNPMVAQISTRGSSEGLMGVTIVALIWAVLARKSRIAGIILGFGIHLKLYPFIYAFSIYCWLGKPSSNKTKKSTTARDRSVQTLLSNAVHKQRAAFVLSAATTFMALNFAMFIRYTTIRQGSNIHLLKDLGTDGHSYNKAFFIISCG